MTGHTEIYLFFSGATQRLHELQDQLKAAMSNAVQQKEEVCCSKAIRVIMLEGPISVLDILCAIGV